MVRRFHIWTSLGTKLISWPLALLTLAAWALQFPVWDTETTLAGPFAAETNPPRAALIVDVPKLQFWMEELAGDNPANASRSTLRFSINGREIGLAHSIHEDIRTGRTTGYSHWGSSVIFSLPPGVENSPKTTITFHYIERMRGSITVALTLLTLLIFDAASLLVLVLCGLGLTASAIYVISILYAWSTGWALPTAALIRCSAIARSAAFNEPYFGYLLLMLAGSGASVSWLSLPKVYRSHPSVLQRYLAPSLFPIVACAYILGISAPLAGIIRPGDPMISNLGGLNPMVDAAAYLAGVHDQAKDGMWDPVTLYRPLAAAFRSTIALLTGYSLPAMLFVQAGLVAAATCFAANAIMLWRGIWAGLSFIALTYIYTRWFVPTTLTESLGIFWAMLSIPLFIEAFRSRSAKPALIAFAMTTVALMTRMGSMFTLPALLVWLVWQFGRSTAAKLRIGAVAICILLGVFGVNSVLQKAYGPGSSPSTGNFSYVICGLTMGTTWDGCIKKLASEGKTLQQIDDVEGRLYSMAWDNFRIQPSVFFYRIGEAARQFFSELPDLIWKGFGFAIPAPNWLLRNALTTVSLVGLMYLAFRSMNAPELTFWLLVWASIVASASLIYPDDGGRTLAASFPLIGFFFASGICIPATSLPNEPASSSRLSRFGALGLIVAGGAFLCVPWMAYHLSPLRNLTVPLVEQADEVLVFGGRRMSGFLIVADDQPLRSDIASLHLTEFETIVQQSIIERRQDLIHPVLPPLPFGFVFAPRLKSGDSSFTQFIVPGSVLEHPDVSSWRFRFTRNYQPNGGAGYWVYVTKAEPFDPK